MKIKPRGLLAVLVFILPVLGAMGVDPPDPGPPYILAYGLSAEQGLPFSSLDLSQYLRGVYRGAAGELIEVYFGDAQAVQLVIDRQGEWEQFVCSSSMYFRAVRYGIDYMVPQANRAVAIGFPLESDNHCVFLQLLENGMRLLESNPEFMFDPFPARLPFGE